MPSSRWHPTERSKAGRAPEEGIASENLERIFEVFTREGDHGTVPGYGIGR